MSSRREFLLQGARWLIAGGAVLSAAGCFQPMYADVGTNGSGTNLRNALRDVEVAKVDGRVSHELRNDIIFELTGGAGNPSNAPYRLNMSVATNSYTALIDPTSGLGQNETVSLDVAYQLRDVANDRVVMKDTATARVTVDTTQQRYARVRAIRDAENKAAQVVSEQIRTRIASFFLVKT